MVAFQRGLRPVLGLLCKPDPARLELEQDPSPFVWQVHPDFVLLQEKTALPLPSVPFIAGHCWAMSPVSHVTQGCLHVQGGVPRAQDREALGAQSHPGAPALGRDSMKAAEFGADNVL